MSEGASGSKPRPKVTLRHIAEAVGVSRATASRALRDNPMISDSIRRKVKDAAIRLGYAPDPEAQRLMTYLRSSREQRFESTLGILNAYDPPSDMHKDRYTRELVAGARLRAEKLGFAVDFLDLRIRGMSPKRLDQIIRSRSIRGLLIPPEPDALFGVDLDWSQVAAVATTTTIQPLSLHRTLPHNYLNNQTLIDAALEAGYQRIGLVSWDKLEARQMNAPSAVYAREGYVRERFTPLPVYHWVWDTAEVLAGHLAHWVEVNQPDCILGFDTFALGALELAGFSAPRDFGYMSYGDAPDHVARIDQKAAAVGSAAMDLLSSQVMRAERGLPATPKTTLIEGRFLPGTTLRAP